MPRSPPSLSPMCHLPKSDTSDSLILFDHSPNIIVTPPPLAASSGNTVTTATSSFFGTSDRPMLTTESVPDGGNESLLLQSHQHSTNAEGQRATRVKWRDLLSSSNPTMHCSDEDASKPLTDPEQRVEGSLSSPALFKTRGRFNALVQQAASSTTENTRASGGSTVNDSDFPEGETPRKWWKSAIHWVRQEKTGMHLYADDLLDRVEHDTRAYMQELEDEEDEPISPQSNRQPRFSTVAMSILRAEEDRDIHPFGRGGRFEGVLYSERKVTVQLDHTKFLAWMFFVGFLLFVSVAIIVLAEIDRASQQSEENQRRR